MNKCISCGRSVPESGRFVLCKACEDTGNALARMLEEGITLEYSDGATEVVKADTAIKSCADCKHMKSWMEYGNVVLDCCHKEGSSYYEQYADTNLDAGPHCPYWEAFNIGDIDPWGGAFNEYDDEHA